MGRQKNFFMLPEDEIEFIKFVKSTGNIAIYPHNLKYIPFKNLEKLPAPFSVKFWMVIRFWNNSIGAVKYRFVSEQGYYVINEDSPIIEFLRSGINEANQLLEGRIYIEPDYTIKNQYGQPEWKKKPAELLYWYEQIARWIGEHYLKDGQLYISRRVQDWMKIGGKLTTGLGQIFTLSDLQKLKRRKKVRK